MLESARYAEFKTADGRARALDALKTRRIDGLIVIWGNGWQTDALSLSEVGFPVNGVAAGSSVGNRR